MKVIIPEAKLKAGGPCDERFFLNSPEWNKSEKALVYEDWDATVTRLMSTRKGIVALDFLVARGLVPMTPGEFKELFETAAKGTV